MSSIEKAKDQANKKGLKVARDWKLHWHSKEGESYQQRIAMVDSNMVHDLGKRIGQKLLEEEYVPQEIAAELLKAVRPLDVVGQPNTLLSLTEKAALLALQHEATWKILRRAASQLQSLHHYHGNDWWGAEQKETQDIIEAISALDMNQPSFCNYCHHITETKAWDCIECELSKPNPEYAPPPRSPDRLTFRKPVHSVDTLKRIKRILEEMGCDCGFEVQVGEGFGEGMCFRCEALELLIKGEETKTESQKPSGTKSGRTRSSGGPKVRT